MTAMDHDKLVSYRAGSAAHVVFNNPERHNAVSLHMWERLHELLADLADDAGVRALVLSGAGGKAFVSGADISKFETERAGRDATERYNATAAAAYEALAAFPRPTIAKISGSCFGGGVNLAVCCDLRVASSDARFGVPAARLGVGYGLDAVRRLANTVGMTFALDLLYTGRHISAAEARSIGLVTHVVAHDELDEYVTQLTETIGRNAPRTIEAIKAAAVELGRNESDRDVARVEALVRACFESDDYIEGRRAFAEKRPPKFTGR